MANIEAGVIGMRRWFGWLGALATVAMLLVPATPAAADSPLDHGTLNGSGCGTAWSVTPNPATDRDPITLTFQGNCGPAALGVSYVDVALYEQPPPGDVVNGTPVPLSPSTCNDHPEAVYASSWSITCHAASLPTGTTFTAVFGYQTFQAADEPLWVQLLVPPLGALSDTNCTYYVEGGAYCTVVVHGVVLPG